MDYSKNEYTTKEAANLLGMSEFTLRRKIRNKEINVIGKKGKSYIISKEDLKQYVKEKGNFNISNTTRKQAEAIANMVIANGLDPSIIFNIATTPIMNSIISSILVSILPVENLKNTFNNVEDNLDIDFYKTCYKSIQRDLNIVKFKLEKLMLDKDNTVEYKKKELDLRIQIETIEKNLQILKMKIDSMNK